MMTTTGINKLFSKNLNLNKMDIFEKLADATNPNRKPFNALKEHEVEQPVNKQKEMEYSEYMKAILFQYHEDCLNDNLPDIVATPECERIYRWAALAGIQIGISSATNIHKEVFESPTLNRYSGNYIRIG